MKSASSGLDARSADDLAFSSSFWMEASSMHWRSHIWSSILEPKPLPRCSGGTLRCSRKTMGPSSSSLPLSLSSRESGFAGKTWPLGSNSSSKQARLGTEAIACRNSFAGTKSPDVVKCENHEIGKDEDQKVKHRKSALTGRFESVCNHSSNRITRTV